MEALTPAEQLRIDVTGRRAATAVATWGQRAIWHCLDSAPEAEAHFNLARTVEVPEGCDTRSVTRAVAELVRAHDALRTVFHFADSRLWQTVQASGTLSLARYQVTDGPDEAARTIAAELAGRPFGRNEWQVRFALVTDGARPSRLAVAVGHLAVDQEGLRQLTGDLRQALAGRRIEPRSCQPLDVAAYEQSPQGRAASERALRHWSRGLRTAPATLFDYPRRAEGTPRFRRLVMRSEAIAVAAELAASRMRVSSTSVLLAATVSALGEFTGHRVVPMQTICSNRENPARRHVVGTLSWDGLITVDTGQASFRQTVRKTFQAGLTAYGNGYYDPEEAWRLRRHHEHLRGATQDLAAHFNDIRGRSGGRVDQWDPGPAALGRLTERTTVAEAACPDTSDARFYLTVRSADPCTLLSLVCDTGYFSVGDMRHVLHAVERVVTAAAHDDLEGPLLGSTLGITRVGRPDWVPYAEGWVDLAAARRLWQEVTGDATARLFLDRATQPPDGTAELVGYLADRPARRAAELHSAFMAALGGRSDVRAPDRYVVCARAPHDPDSREAWARETVLSEGSGRDDA
ncbi:condensation domain-containing protein [Streptomyces sp. H51]|uniref:condensation domain-containing protein n=1 Tax=Streptomyces sp. H51 TaxID=3111770 RepID=UPI002D76FD85|nr:condensation domain-containing protein [Streptomyces sp. H51]